MTGAPIALDGAVADAVARGAPVVALETALLTHGLPRPINLEVARAIETAVRDAGAVPATIGVLDGRVRVGLDDDALARLATADDARKVSRRDLPLAVARDALGGTTVAAALWVANRVGLRVLSTGGIGGVHRGAPHDVSADLPTLGRTPLTVVCSGAKSILDLPRTLEALETHGVPVLGWRTDRLPAFFAPDSGLPVTARVSDAADVARVAAARDALGARHALLVTVPVPADAALDAARAERAAVDATAAAEAADVHGPALTPDVLARVAERTDGASVRANRALLVSNARVAAAIAVAMVAGDEARSRCDEQ